jgi:lipoprotein-anchoring transpeptidase ErfK/SrfK
MRRASLSCLFILIAAVFSFASAAQQPQMSGDPAIDAQWAQLASAENPVGSRPVDPLTAPATGIFRAFGGSRYTPEQAQAMATPPQLRFDPAFLPKVVNYSTKESPGTIVIDTHAKYLYVVLGDGKAERYGVGVGREGFGWTGRVHVGRKAEWPTWTPPSDMVKRQPELAKYEVRGMPGGVDNPLGARAMYLYDASGNDTLFRIHGSNEPWTIGHAVSSGCIRMRNEDVIKLFDRTPIGTTVIVL